MDYIIRFYDTGPNSPRNQVRRGKDGLWHVWFAGHWLGAFGKWEKAVEVAHTGVIRWYE